MMTIGIPKEELIDVSIPALCRVRYEFEDLTSKPARYWIMSPTTLSRHIDYLIKYYAWAHDYSVQDLMDTPRLRIMNLPILVVQLDEDLLEVI